MYKIILSIVINILLLWSLSFFAYTQLYQDNNAINQEAETLYLNKWDILIQDDMIKNEIELIVYNKKSVDKVVLSGNITYVSIATVYENMLWTINYASIINEEEIIEKNSNVVSININNINHKKLTYSYPTICQSIPFMWQQYCPLLWKQIWYRITVSKQDDAIFEIIAQ